MAFLREETKKRGFPTVDGVHMGPCEIHRSHAHTIGPDGSLYACPGFAGDAPQSIGHIDGRHEPARAQAASPVRSARRRGRSAATARSFPVCAGGCTVAAHNELGDIDKPNCHKTAIQAGLVSLAHQAAAERLRNRQLVTSTHSHPSQPVQEDPMKNDEETGQERHAPSLARRRRRRQPALSPPP